MHRQSAKEDLSGAFGTGLGEHWLSLVSTAGYGNSSRMVYWTRVSNALNRTCPRRSLEQTDASSMMTADLTGLATALSSLLPANRCHWRRSSEQEVTAARGSKGFR